MLWTKHVIWPRSECGRWLYWWCTCVLMPLNEVLAHDIFVNLSWSSSSFSLSIASHNSSPKLSSSTSLLDSSRKLSSLLAMVDNTPVLKFWSLTISFRSSISSAFVFLWQRARFLQSNCWGIIIIIKGLFSFLIELAFQAMMRVSFSS